MTARGNHPRAEKGIAMIGYTMFLRLLEQADDCETLDAFIADFGGAVGMGDESAVVQLMTMIWAIRGGMTIKAIAQEAGTSVRRFGMTYGIPVRTLENWSSGVNRPSEWLLPLIAYAVIADAMEPGDGECATCQG